MSSIGTSSLLAMLSLADLRSRMHAGRLSDHQRLEKETNGSTYH